MAGGGEDTVAGGAYGWWRRGHCGCGGGEDTVAGGGGEDTVVGGGDVPFAGDPNSIENSPQFLFILQCREKNNL